MVKQHRTGELKKSKKGISFHSLALRILESEGRPMKIKELTKKILDLTILFSIFQFHFLL